MNTRSLSSPSVLKTSNPLRLALVAVVATAVLLVAFPSSADAGAGASGGRPPAARVEFSGVIGSLPSGSTLVGDWTVGGKTVHVGATTKVQTGGVTPAVGDFATVDGTIESDGSVDAAEIVVVGPNPGPHPVDFVGTISALPATPGLIGDWTVNGKTVHVTSSTKINQDHGQAAVGAKVEVKGTVESDGSIDANAIKVLASPPGAIQVDFHGLIQALPSTADLTGDWTVSGKTVHVSATTTIDQTHGTVAIGAEVEVHGQLESDGSVDADKIKVMAPAPGSISVEFKGIVKTLPGTSDFTGDWTVDSTTVHVTSSTKINQDNGAVAVGDVVEVKGTLEADHSVDAAIIIVLQTTPPAVKVEFKGIIGTLPGNSDFIGDWVVSGRTVHVTSTTMIDQSHGAVAVGAVVNVEGIVESDGSVDATRIEVLEPGGGQIFVEFIGPIVSLPGTADLIGDWVVAGVTVHVSSTTTLDPGKGKFVVGTWVHVEGLFNADLSVSALKITLDDGQGRTRSHLGHH